MGLAHFSANYDVLQFAVENSATLCESMGKDDPVEHIQQLLQKFFIDFPESCSS